MTHKDVIRNVASILDDKKPKYELTFAELLIFALFPKSYFIRLQHFYLAKPCHIPHL